MFKELSAIRNTPVATSVMIHHVLKDVSRSIYTIWDIHRILVHIDKVTITLVDKESELSLFKDITYDFSGTDVTNNMKSTSVYGVSTYCAR